MSATVFKFAAATCNQSPLKAKKISVDIEDLESIQIEIRAARSALVLAIKAGIDGSFRADVIGEAFFSVLRTMENACKQIDKTKEEA